VLDFRDRCIPGRIGPYTDGHFPTTPHSTISMSLIRSLAPLSLVAVALAGCSPAERVTDARALIRAMHDAYADVRPASLVFVQETVLHRKPDSPPDTVIWYEAAVPGRLRIDFAPASEGNGALYRDGSLFVMHGGRVVVTRPEVNPLQLLLMDVFQFPPEKTVETLDTLGFDLSVFREADWDGRPVWVVGASPEDSSSAQFWVDRERLVTLRVVQPVGGGTRSWDSRVTGFRDMDGYPQEDRLLMFLDGRLYQEETYLDIQVGIDVDPALFDTTGWIVTVPYWE